MTAATSQEPLSFEKLPVEKESSRLAGKRMKVIHSSSPRNVSVTAFSASNQFHSATASADDMGAFWWVNRVWVHETLRGKGLGRFLVMEMLGMIKEHGGRTIRVAPGGYGENYGDQCAFYRACGFVEVEEGLMEVAW